VVVVQALKLMLCITEVAEVLEVLVLVQAELEDSLGLTVETEMLPLLLQVVMQMVLVEQAAVEAELEDSLTMPTVEQADQVLQDKLLYTYSSNTNP
jgi:hypothetical protein